MIQLTRQGLAGSVDIAQLADQFEHSHVFRLPGLLHTDLVQFVSSKLNSCTWTTESDGDIARESVPGDPAPMAVLNFACCTFAFLDLMRQITRYPQISWFGGRVYRMEPNESHGDSWHADLGSATQDRFVGMSINLGQRPYQGGVFRLRDQANNNVLCELPNTVQGDAIFFRISPGLRHMVTPICGSEPKTAFAGWFRSGVADYYAGLRESRRSATAPPNEERVATTDDSR